MDVDDWVEQVKSELGIAVDPDVPAILDVARDAAHNVARPAAPITTFLMGVAVAQGADPADVARRIADLAATWPSAD